MILVCNFSPSSAREPSERRLLRMTADGEPFAGELVSIDARGTCSFAPPLANRSGVALLSEPGPLVPPGLPEPQTLVLLGDGSRLVTAADWSGGDGRADRRRHDHRAVRYMGRECGSSGRRSAAWCSPMQQSPAIGGGSKTRCERPAANKIKCCSPTRTVSPARVEELSGGTLTLDHGGRPTSNYRSCASRP